ncbi:hypothetical protein L227DRAFT_617799 [Lentinus tigrinus ALCF2SS1-6]|uniref:Uncharacterized protein n=1 Tax=Lentinus tigrinus ALCF2SS1-6 TaxID=1328759 RepID=A0A5C2RMW5_9APHY|nr:hypothetical protein L227DRAFT_617799 [Lentinus tigrinus ALCF2SS1-6]
MFVRLTLVVVSMIVTSVVSQKVDFQTCASPLTFDDEVDAALHNASAHHTFSKANVGSLLGKTFMQYAQDGTLVSPFAEAMDALDKNAQCSYWISASGHGRVDIPFPLPQEEGKKWGIILPQVISMGTVTRLAIEKTWLTGQQEVGEYESNLSAHLRHTGALG